MPTFASLDDLKSSLAQAGLARLAAPIAATARPDLMFWRKTCLDADLPIGVSKIGGQPDLPETFAWPWREPFADANARERQDRAFIERFRETIGADAAQRNIERLPFLHRRFPLAFVGQFDLGIMALEPGFDESLPDSGLLSVFYDITDGYCGGPRLFWHDASRDHLRRQAPPRDLIAYYEDLGSLQMDDIDALRETLLQADTLHPVSGLSVPAHWRDARVSQQLTDALDQWFDNEPGTIAMANGDDATQFYGDHMGGWPSPIQGDPETEIDEKEIVSPGETRWRHILSLNVGECTMVMALDSSSDGQHYIFMDEDDLAARRFDRAKAVHQMT